MDLVDFEAKSTAIVATIASIFNKEIRQIGGEGEYC
jgi:hypothetical protein